MSAGLRVLLDCTFAQRGPSGTATYLGGLSAALSQAGVEVVEAVNAQRAPPAGGGLGSAANLLADRWWTEVELPRRARRERVDVLHHPLPDLSLTAPCPQVVTVHDLAFVARPDLFAWGFATYAGRAHRRAVRHAQAVLCVSQATRTEVLRRWGPAPERVLVAYHGVSGPAAPPSPPPGGACPPSRPYFLYVGDDEPRKGLAALVDAYARYRALATASGQVPLDLLLAGSARASGSGIVDAGAPDSDALARLYAGAGALVHPAVTEGFGLTPLEAMAAGAPVLAVTAAAVVEVCGPAARYVVPGDREALAAGMLELAGDPAERARLSAEGRVRARAFSWASSARVHVAAYTLALG